MIQEHYYFRLPEDPDAKVWRYLSFTKFVSLLETQALHFARSDQFDDPYEGTVPERVQEFAEEFFAGLSGSPGDLGEEFIQLIDSTRKFTYLSCWHVNASESDAMWRLYAFQNEGVAIQSTVGRLRKVLEAAPDKMFLGLVRYADYEEVDPGVFLNGVTPFIFKRKSFEHEQELRAVAWMDRVDSAEVEGDTVWLMPPKEHVRMLDVDVSELVESIVVSPTAPGWFEALVSAVTRKYGFEIPVRQSRLYAEPDRRAARVEPDGGQRFSITRELIDHLHSQHLQYSEMKLRETERLAQREAEAIDQWLARIEKDVGELRIETPSGPATGREALLAFAQQVGPMSSIEEMLAHPLYQKLYLLSGRFDNVVRVLQQSSIPAKEKDFTLRRLIFLYTETVFMAQMAVMVKTEEQCPDPSQLPEESRNMIGPMISQAVTLRELMLKEKI